MFWDKGYTPSQNIEALLEKESATVEEFLDDDDVLQECKTLKKSIVKYFTRPEVIKRLVEIITTEPSDELPLAQRFRHANMACEILTLGLPSLDEKILADSDTLKILYSYLENEPPLNPLLSSFFHKTFCMLFTKKPEQDWFLYQQMCLQLLEYLKSRGNFLDLIFKHFSTPVIPELILQLLKDFEGGQLKRNLYEWLTEEKLVDRLIAILGKPDECDKHSNVTEFLCDLIKQGRTMRQTEHENDSFEPAFDGSNPILKTIESEATIEALLNVILEPNAQESAIVSGISVVLTLIKPNTLVDETYSDRSKFLQNREKEISEQIASTVIRVMAPRLNELNQLLKSPPPMPPINTTAAKLAPPFGNTRLQVCRVFSVLLQTKNEEINKAICATDFFETILDLFKEYCWNNFLHSEFEKCMQIIFESSGFNNNNNSAQGSTIANDGSISKSSINSDTANGTNSTNFFDIVTGGGATATASTAAAVAADNGSGNGEGDGDKKIEAKELVDDEKAAVAENMQWHDGEDIDVATVAVEKADIELAAEAAEMETNSLSISPTKEISNEVANATETVVEPTTENNLNSEPNTDEAAVADEAGAEKGESKITNNEESSFKEKESLKNPTDIGPSALQRHLIVNCKLITKLIDCWQHNQAKETAERGRRLGYMGYLIKTLKHITNCISESEHIGALIECNLSDEAEREKWQLMTNTKDGDLTKALAIQNRLLANCNAHEACDFGHLAKDFLSDNSTWEYIMSSNVLNNLGGFTDTFSDFIESNHDAVLTFVEDEDQQTQGQQFNSMFQFDNNFELDDEEDDDELGGGNNAAGNGSSGSGTAGGLGSLDFTNKLTFFGKNTKSTNLSSLGVGNGSGGSGGSGGSCGSGADGTLVAATAAGAAGAKRTTNPWYDVDPFANLEPNSSSTTVGPWSSDFDHDNFADFETHFSTFTSDLGESLSGAATTDAKQKNDDGVDGGKLSDDVAAAAAAAAEYDNNANVEKTTSSVEDDDEQQLTSTISATKSPTATSTTNSANDDIGGIGVPHMLVRTLQSVMQESEDDYEDDEGMWTKPLGSAANADDNNDIDDDEARFVNENVENEKNSKSFATLASETSEAAQENNTAVLVNGTNAETNAQDQSVESPNKAPTAASNPAMKSSKISCSDEVGDAADDVEMNDILAADVKKSLTAIETANSTSTPAPAPTAATATS